MKRSLLFLALALAFTSTLLAQDLYTVRVGVFRDVKAEDFSEIRSLGFLYGITTPDQTMEVFVGQYSDQNKATAIAADLVGRGFRNAQAFTLPTASGQEVTVIQLALHSGDRPIEWGSLERAGDLYVETVDGTTKIMTGIYADGQRALQFLPAIRALGFRDAFVKKINNVRLVPIGTFETGIKKPLIPLSLEERTTAAQATLSPPLTPADQLPPSSTTRDPATYAPPTTAPAGAPAPSVALPAIDGRIKRHSAAELQKVLKEKGYYDGSIDGYYGPGTSSAYAAAWANMPEIDKYRRLVLPPTDAISQWPEANVLLAISHDLAAGNTNQARAQQLGQLRAQLFQSTQKLSPVAATRARNWVTTVWGSLDEWATQDPLHARIVSAFRVAYHQTQVRLEDLYMDRGLRSDDARDLAAALLQSLVGADLDRFL